MCYLRIKHQIKNRISALASYVKVEISKQEAVINDKLAVFDEKLEVAIQKLETSVNEVAKRGMSYFMYILYRGSSNKYNSYNYIHIYICIYKHTIHSVIVTQSVSFIQILP